MKYWLEGQTQPLWFPWRRMPGMLAMIATRQRMHRNPVMNPSAPQAVILTPAEALQRYREELCQYDQKGQLVVLPGVIGALFFQRGSRPEVRQGLLACFDRFEQLFGTHLKGGKDRDDGKFTRRTPRGVEAIRRAILETPPEMEVSAVRSSATSQDMAAAYQIETLTNIGNDEDYTSPEGWSRQAGEDLGLSYMKFHMPMDLLESTEGIRTYEDFLRFVCGQLPVCGGYGGLSPVLPYFFHPYMPQEWELAKRFSGLEIDSYAFLQQDYYDVGSYEGEDERETAIYGYLHPGAKIFKYGFIKCVNWYTIIDELFIDRLGGEEVVRTVLARPIFFHECCLPRT